MKKTNMGVSDQVEKNPSSRPGTPGLGYGRFFVHKDPSSVKISPSRAPLTASSASMIKSSTTTTAAATPSATTTTSALPSTATSLSRPASAPATAGATNDPPTFFTKPTASRAKSIIMLNNKPIAVSMKSDKPEPETPVPSAAPPKLKQPAPTKQSTESENPLKFRMWAPREQRKSILVSIGQRMAQMRAERIFDSSQMRTKTYNEWRKEAQAQLPSMTGGAVVEKLADALHAAPILQKENTKKTMQIIRRLSEGSEKKPLIPEPRKSSGVDYTKIREVRLSVKSEDTTSSDESTDTVVEIDNEQEIARLEYERKQAGIDFKAKIQTLKQLADHLSNKRAVRQQLVQKATGFTVLDAEEIPIKEHILYAIEYMGDVVHDAFTYLILWEKQIREINGKYGVVTANYFTWVREMIGLELLGFFFVIVIIMIPQFFQQNYGEFENEGSSVPKGVVHDELRHFHITDLIHGEGYFHYSYLYYTGYHRRNEDSSNPFENPAFRFLFCLFVEFIVLTYFIFSRLTKYYQSARMESTVSGVANVETFKTVVCGWDYSCRDEQGAAYLHQTIFRELKFLARKHTEGIKMVHLELEHKKALALAVKYFGIFWGTWTIHIVGNVVIIGVCAILGVILLYLCKLKLYYYNNCVSLRDDNEHRGLHDPILCPDGDESLYLWVLSLPALFASITMLLLTKLILLVGDMESWSSPERKIYATMLRAGLFYFTNIGVFYTFWLKAKPQLDAEGFVAEGIFGKELYRLVVIQGLTEVILNLGLKGLYHLIRRRSPSYKMTEFRTEYCCLSMFFNFSVSRIGVLFCPPLSAFVVLRLIVDFYQNRFILFNMSSREGYSAHVSQVYAPFLLTFFILCYLITTFMNVYYLTDTIPSNYDGPFQQYNESYGEVLTNLLSSKKRTEWIAGLVHPGFLMTFLAILAGLAYFCREWALTYEPIIIQLNELIFLERGDRDLLLKAIFEIGKVTGDDILVGEGDNTRAEHKMRRAAAKREADLVPSSEAETDFEEEYEEEEEADKHIAELIHHVQRRKSVGFTVEGGRASRVHRDKVGHHRRSTKKVQAEHAEHVESIVAKIVDARRRRSLQLPPAEMGRHTSLIPEDSPAFQKYIKDYGKNHPPTTEQHPHQSEPSTQRKSQYLHVPSSSGHQHQQQPGQSKPQHIPVPLSEVRKSTIHPSPSLPAAITPAKKEAPHPRAPKKSPKQLLIQDLNALLSKTTHHQPGTPGHKKK